MLRALLKTVSYYMAGTIRKSILADYYMRVLFKTTGESGMKLTAAFNPTRRTVDILAEKV